MNENAAMNEDKTGRRQGLGKHKIIRFILGVVPFGFLMGIQREFPSIWGRTLVAGCAGAILAIAMGPLARGQGVGGREITRFILGVVFFGVLMGIREEFPSIWVRALVAGCAFAIVMVPMGPLERRKG